MESNGPTLDDLIARAGVPEAVARFWAETVAARTVDLRRLPPPRRHPLVLGKLDEMAPGEGLCLINDHDPRPFYYYLLHERTLDVAWEYLQEGPLDWAVILTRVAGRDLRGLSPAEALRQTLAGLRETLPGRVFLGLYDGGWEEVSEHLASQGFACAAEHLPGGMVRAAVRNPGTPVPSGEETT